MPLLKQSVVYYKPLQSITSATTVHSSPLFSIFQTAKSMFFGVLSVKFCDLPWHELNMRAIIINWKNMTTEAHINTANRFDPDFCCSSVLLVIALFLWGIFTLFSLFWYFFHQKLHFPWNSVNSVFTPNSVIFVCFPYCRKLGTLNLDTAQYSCFMRHTK